MTTTAARAPVTLSAVGSSEFGGWMSGTDAAARRADREARFAGYRQARLWVRGVPGQPALLEVRPAAVGTTSGAFPFATTAHVLTAFDPGAERLGPVENARRQEALVAALPQHVERWEVEAGAVDGSHTEASVLVTGLSDDEAVALGARFGQDAIFRWTPDAWSILPCDGGAPEHSGWSVGPATRPRPTSASRGSEA